jgi:hypothetical protein
MFLYSRAHGVSDRRTLIHTSLPIHTLLFGPLLRCREKPALCETQGSSEPGISTVGDEPNPPYDHENSGDSLSGQWFAEAHVTRMAVSTKPRPTNG